ncbi:DUF4184 family protein [Nocardiopsis sp. NPDC049922]|uniref:DUF4184 family protein n=1 Tax=Nocardiopsis sp. NPDC049922 TaxID=3155157 RepID=UPI00340C7AAA
MTLAHPAAVVPLLRRPFVPAALVAGAMAPDLPYFLRVPVSAQSWYEPFTNATATHSLIGMILLDLPITAALLLGYLLIRDPVAALLPARLVGIPRQPRREGWAVFAFWLLASAVIGVATHLAWDALTHGDSAVVQNVAFLRADVVDGLTWNRLLQHLSSVLGLAVLAIVLVRRWRATDPDAEEVRSATGGLSPRGRLFAVAALGAVAVLGAVSLWSREAADEMYGDVSVEYVLATLVKGGGAALLAGILLFSVVWHLSRLSTRDRRTPPSVAPDRGNTVARDGAPETDDLGGSA